MNNKIINIILGVLTLVLLVTFVNLIYSRVNFENEYASRKKVITKKLQEIKQYQLAYKDSKGQFADNFDSLTHFILTDTFNLNIVKQLGFDSLNEPILDTTYTYMAVKDSLMPKDYTIEETKLIPFSENKSFKINAGTIRKGNVTVQVFQVDAPFGDFLNDLDENLYDPQEAWTLGSMTEATYGGNW